MEILLSCPAAEQQKRRGQQHGQGVEQTVEHHSRRQAVVILTFVNVEKVKRVKVPGFGAVVNGKARSAITGRAPESRCPVFALLVNGIELNIERFDDEIYCQLNLKRKEEQCPKNKWVVKWFQ